LAMGKIYTKKGDKGRTKTFRGEMGKSDALAEALGSIDEVNSWIGVCRQQIFNYQFLKIDAALKRIQGNLLTIGSGLAGSKLRIGSGEVRNLEKLIDKLTADLPKLTNFIYPVGELQVARSVARRCERRIVSYSLFIDRDKKKVDKKILVYLNRLSDALFVMARWVNYQRGIGEEVWRG